MSDSFTLAIDAMGGDRAPEMVVAGLNLAAERHPAARFLLAGDQAALAPLLKRHKRAAAASTVRHAPETISNDLKPTAALRMRGASMRVAIDAVACGEASGIVSAGNTGALLALAKIVIKALPGIDRPAMATISPSVRGDVVMLDLGANVDCDARNLVEFAVMGDVFARTVLGLDGADHRADERRLRGAQGRQPHPPGGRCAARELSRAAVPRLHRRPRHRRRHHRRDRHRRLHRQCCVEDRAKATPS